MRRNPTLSLLSLTALTAISGVNAAESEDSLASVIERTVPLRTHSLAAPYVDTDLQNRWWDFGGDTIIVRHIHLYKDDPLTTTSEYKQTCPPHPRQTLPVRLALGSHASLRIQLANRCRVQSWWQGAQYLWRWLGILVDFWPGEAGAGFWKCGLVQGDWYFLWYVGQALGLVSQIHTIKHQVYWYCYMVIVTQTRNMLTLSLE